MLRAGGGERTLAGDTRTIPCGMTVIVNAERRELPVGATVLTLLEALNLAHAACAVELNRTLIRKAAHATTTLNEGDTLEIVTLVGGG